MFDQYVIDALDIVTSNWDLPDDQLADAISTQAMYMAGIDPGESWEDPQDIH